MLCLGDKIRYTLLAHKEKFLQGVLKHTHIMQNVNTQMRLKIWTVYIEKKYLSHQSSQQNGLLLQNYAKNQICTGCMI